MVSALKSLYWLLFFEKKKILVYRFYLLYVFCLPDFRFRLITIIYLTYVVWFLQENNICDLIMSLLIEQQLEVALGPKWPLLGLETVFRIIPPQLLIPNKYRLFLSFSTIIYYNTSYIIQPLSKVYIQYYINLLYKLP